METGWTESYGQYKGDASPHLFIFPFDCNKPVGYVGLEPGVKWVQTSKIVFPNMTLPIHDQLHVYGIHKYGNNWWINYDEEWIGYLPQQNWPTYFPVMLSLAEAGGEVATPTSEYSTCSDMGVAGLYGSSPWASWFYDVWRENESGTAHLALTKYESDPGQYTTGQWNRGYPGSEFRYGGPGWC